MLDVLGNGAAVYLRMRLYLGLRLDDDGFLVSVRSGTLHIVSYTC